MTLITTEIHNYRDPDNTFILFAADRRISWGDGKEDDQIKIFELPFLNAGMGFYGLVEAAGMPMHRWVEKFLDENKEKFSTLEQLVECLKECLNKDVPRAHKKSRLSGFQISGFNNKNEPEFWHVSNNINQIPPFLEEYRSGEDFLNRDAAEITKERIQIYRNGDIRSHVLAWTKIDEAFTGLIELDDFKKIQNPGDYKNWIKFKMEMIANFYETFATRSIIGKPVDVFIIPNKTKS